MNISNNIYCLAGLDSLKCLFDMVFTGVLQHDRVEFHQTNSNSRNDVNKRRYFLPYLILHQWHTVSLRDWVAGALGIIAMIMKGK